MFCWGSSCFRKVFGSRGFWVLVWRALEWEIVVYFEIPGPFLEVQSTEKDSDVGQGSQVTSISISLLNLVHFEVF